MAVNSSVIADEDGDYSDWIELFNYGSEEIDLTGFGLSDNASSPFKWTFPATIVQPKSYMLVWASGKDKIQPGEPLHAGFSINSAGEDILLTDSQGQLIDLIPAVAIPANLSYGRQPDGTGNLQFFTEPTPNAPNASQGIGELLSPPVFSHPSGYYNEPFTLTISSEVADATIIYTVDGSEPDIDNLSGTSYQYVNQYPQNPGQTLGPFLTQTFTSHTFTGPLEIVDRTSEPNKLSAISTTYNNSTWYLPSSLNKKANVVRAKVYKNGFSSKTATFTYFVSQTSSFDHSLPVVSINLNEDGLFDYYKGIMVAGEDFVKWREQNPTLTAHGGRPANYARGGEETEQRASFQLFVDKDLALYQNIGLRLHGGFSRQPANKSLRLYARSEYDEKNTFDYPIFENSIHNSFKRLVLRNSGNDRNLTFFRDAFMHASVRHLSFDTHDYRPAVVYINGEYWGLANFRERYDKHYLERVYGIGEGDLDLLENNAFVEEGDSSHFLAMREYISSADLSIQENYDYLSTLMDIDNFLEYNVAQIYFNNDDWPHNNVRIFRKRTSQYIPEAPPGQDGRWRWLMYDTDHGFGLNGDFTSNTLRHATNPGGANPWSTLILRRLLLSESFKIAFINKFADLINTAMVPERLHAMIDEMSSRIASEVPAHRVRWSSLTQWEESIEVMKAFAVNRPQQQVGHLMEYFDIAGTHQVNLDVANHEEGVIRINNTVIDSETPGVNDVPYPWSGTYFEGIPLSLTAIPRPGFQFSHWSGDMESMDSTLSIAPTSTVSLKAHFVPEDTIEDDHEVLYFWLIDNNVPNDTPLESIQSTFSHSDTPALLHFESALSGYPFENGHPNWRKSSMERRNSPTPVNYYPEANQDQPFGSVSMRGIQVKQAFRTEDGENLLNFTVPTTGFDRIKFSFAAVDEGAADHVVLEYWDSVSGAFSSEGITNEGTKLLDVYKKFEFDLSEVSVISNSPSAVFRIRFEGPDMQADDGARVTFNNFAVTGIAMDPDTTEPPSPIHTAVFINTGSSSSAIFDNQEFQSDFQMEYFDSGSKVNQSSSASTLELFQSQRFGEKVVYRIPVQNGTYTVATYHKETETVGGDAVALRGRRVFSIAIQGFTVKEDLDLFLENNNKETILTFEDIRVENGQIEINLTASSGDVTISGLAIVQKDLETHLPTLSHPSFGFSYFVNAGGSQVVYENNLFESDLGSGYFSESKSSRFDDPGVHELFKTHRFGIRVNYEIPVPDGTYRVFTFHNELTYSKRITTSGFRRRVFDVFIQGEKVKDQLDMFSESGNGPLVLQFNDIEVSGGMIDLEFRASIDSASISGIGIVKQSDSTVDLFASIPPRSINDQLGVILSNEIVSAEQHKASQLFPNPASEEAVLRVNNKQSKFSVNIFSINGNLVDVLLPEWETSGLNEYVISVKELGPGYYLVVLIFENGIVERHKLMIQR
ncbi:MAG: CotH kinase family protein [Lunatimonas sp.]|nr:CotH kinase family protein [Lunatimonas sp.]